MTTSTTTFHETMSHADEKAAIDRLMAHRVVSGGHWLAPDLAHNADGYVVIRVGSRTDGSRRMVQAVDVVGDYYHPGSGGQFDHTCGVQGCFNPAHVRRVSQQQNLANRHGYASQLKGWHTH